MQRTAATILFIKAPDGEVLCLEREMSRLACLLWCATGVDIQMVERRSRSCIRAADILLHHACACAVGGRRLTEGWRPAARWCALLPQPPTTAMQVRTHGMWPLWVPRGCRAPNKSSTLKKCSVR